MGDLQSLTKREREVLGLIGKGLSLAEIADKLYRSQKTIQTHRLSLGRKLGVSNRVELARIAIKAGLSPLEPNEGEGVNGPTTRSEDTAAWHALSNIEAMLPAVGGPAYFRKLTQALTRGLHVRTAGICEISEDGADLLSLALIHDGELIEDLSYPIKGSTCEAALKDGLTFIQEGVQNLFPENPLLNKINGEA